MGGVVGAACPHASDPDIVRARLDEVDLVVQTGCIGHVVSVVAGAAVGHRSHEPVGGKVGGSRIKLPPVVALRRVLVEVLRLSRRCRPGPDPD